MKPKAYLPVVILFLIAFPSFAALNAYMKMDTIQGESTDPAHPGWIDISSLNWGTANTPGVTTATPGAARCSIHSLNFTKRVDKASPLIARTALGGAPIPNVTLESGGERHMLQNVTIGSVRQIPGAAGAMETVTLNFSRCATHDRASALMTSAVKQKVDLAANSILIGLSPRPEAASFLSLNFIGTTQARVVARGTSALMRACANGKHFPVVKITTRTGQTWQFSDVVISQFTGGVHPGNDEFTLVFAKVDGPMIGFQDLAYKE